MTRPIRSPWSRFWGWAYRFFVGPFEEKSDGHRRGSMTRWAVWLFTLAFVYRLLTAETLGWPDAVLAFAVLFALPISRAMYRAPPEKVVEGVTGMFGRKDDARTVAIDTDVPEES